MVCIASTLLPAQPETACSDLPRIEPIGMWGDGRKAGLLLLLQCHFCSWNRSWVKHEIQRLFWKQEKRNLSEQIKLFWLCKNAFWVTELHFYCCQFRIATAVCSQAVYIWFGLDTESNFCKESVRDPFWYAAKEEPSRKEQTRKQKGSTVTSRGSLETLQSFMHYAVSAENPGELYERKRLWQCAVSGCHCAGVVIY